MLGLATAVDTLLPAIGSLGTGLTAIGGGIAALVGKKALGALIPSLTTLSGLVGAGKKGGVIGTALFGSFGLGFGFGEAINKITESFSGQSIGSHIYDWFGPDSTDLVTKFSEEMKVSAQRVKDLAEAQEDSVEVIEKSASMKKIDLLVMQDQTDEMIKAQRAQVGYGDALESSAESQGKSAGALAQVSEAIKIGGDAVEEAAKSTIELAENSNRLSIEYDQATGKINSWSGAMKTNEKALASQAEKTKEAIKQTSEYQLKLLELSSDERIANIEANVSLNIAQLEADTKTAVAIIETLGTSVETTGALLGSLFGSLSGATRSDQIAITKQIALENTRRDDELKLTKELTQAQIELIRKKTDAMSRGDSLIKVEGANVSPHIEAFMFEILGAIQLRASQEGLEFLIGAT